LGKDFLLQSDGMRQAIRQLRVAVLTGKLCAVAPVVIGQAGRFVLIIGGVAGRDA
jgi:hypothetical protein